MVKTVILCCVFFTPTGTVTRTADESAHLTLPSHVWLVRLQFPFSSGETKTWGKSEICPRSWSKWVVRLAFKTKQWDSSPLVVSLSHPRKIGTRKKKINIF